MQVGKRQFVFGLAWPNTHEVPAKELLRDAKADEEFTHYQLLKRPKQEPAIGFYADGEERKIALYSAAAAVAATRQDGIYVALLEAMSDNEAAEPAAWYVVISGGLVLPETDMVVPLGQAIAAAESLRPSLGIPLFTSGISHEVLPDAVPFELGAMLAAAKIPALKKLKESQILGAVVLLAVVAAIALAAYFLFFQKKEILGPSPEEQARQIKTNYLQGLRGAVPPYTFDGGWVTSAYRMASDAFPPVIDGWRQDGVMCTPESCTATYSIEQGGVFALSGMQSRFGTGAVKVLDDRRSLTVSLPVEGAQIFQWNDETLLRPPPTSARALDAAGLLGYRFADVVVDGAALTENLGAQLTAPPDAGHFQRDTIATKSERGLDLTHLKGLAAHFAKYGFSASTVTYSSGMGGAPVAWRVQWVRYSGGEQ